MFDAAPDECGSRALIVTAALAVGLLTGFAGGYVMGQRHGSNASSNSTSKAGEGPAPIEPDIAAQSYTENAVVEASSSAGSTRSRPPAESTGNRVAKVPDAVAKARVATAPAPRASTTRPAAPTGAMLVVSRPRGAEVFLDGRLVGTTPMSLSDVPAGRHTVRIVLPDHRRWATTVTVAAGGRARVAASLER
ncbi:MAG TPA: PEGA domain-containing protein [Vicinamibacterales bacterium]